MVWNEILNLNDVILSSLWLVKKHIYKKKYKYGGANSQPIFIGKSRALNQESTKQNHHNPTGNVSPQPNELRIT